MTERTKRAYKKVEDFIKSIKMRNVFNRRCASCGEILTRRPYWNIYYDPLCPKCLDTEAYYTNHKRGKEQYCTYCNVCILFTKESDTCTGKLLDFDYCGTFKQFENGEGEQFRKQ